MMQGSAFAGLGEATEASQPTITYVQQDEEVPFEEAEHYEEVVPAEIWLLVALVILLVVAYKPFKRVIINTLDSRAAKIKAELDEAQRLREEAQSALANIQRRHRDAMAEAGEIISHARADAERLREKAARELEETLERREAMAMDRIAHAEASALAEVRNMAVDVAVAAAHRLIAQQVDRKRASALIDDAIEQLPQKLQ
jgi:F-type H+-transporting ATPase subunit b